MYHIVYTEKAESDFSDIYRYIAEDSTERASAYLSRMEDCILGLREISRASAAQEGFPN